ncbi:DUF6118 family protein [Sphingobium chlorophenolicum]|uniref:Uncharacterized protein n=1 Tax=Sphingobium chlorophenolicum TaxID=46429 RepID=A0A081R915_SPHCR|nr:DUF6118 family protein [Sphingobium chlorophenolicum]KEQ51688.1 hypothetical protein BV95_04022 [Sphingobium chlorophenolicum]
MDETYRDESASDGDPALAFERLRGEVALLRRAVEGLTAARESIDIPDYEPTLARTEKVLGILAQQVEGMRKNPAMMLTPETLGGRLNATIAEATRELQAQVRAAKSTLDDAARAMSGLVASARRGEQQNRWLLWTGLGGLALGLLLYAVFAGPIARAMPARWHWPERLATRVLGERSAWDAGQHLMQMAAPESWAMIVTANPLADGNREALEACRDTAAKIKKLVRCTIEVREEGKDRPLVD